MPTLAILFFIFIGFYIGLFFGIFLAYVLRKWCEEDRILAEDVENWIEENEE